MANTTTQTSADVQAYLAALDPAKRADSEVLIRIGRDVTGQPAAMWGKSIVGFGSYHYRYATGREGDAALLSFAPRAKAFTLYLGAAGLDQFQPLLDRLGKHRTGAGCLYINRLADIDVAVLTELAEAAVNDCRARYPQPPLP